MRTRTETYQELRKKYPPSEPCDCAVCKAYCRRPGWWTVEQVRNALRAGYAGRMMLELSPDHSFGVLSPAFRGCEGFYALQEYAEKGCSFLCCGLCELHDTPYMPLECSFCHHQNLGKGEECHNDIGTDWNTKEGQNLVGRWLFLNNLADVRKRH